MTWVWMIHAGLLPYTETMKGRRQYVASSSVRVWRKTGWVLEEEYYDLYPDERPEPGSAAEESTTTP